MEEIFAGLFYLIFNFIGATVRWIYGSIWRTIFNKPKFTFKQYVQGLEKTDNFFDKYTHGWNNAIIGVITFFVLGSIIVKWNL